MNIGVLGTGMVGRALSGKLADAGDAVVIGSRDPVALLDAPGSDQLPAFHRWREQHTAVGIGTFREAAAHGDVLVLATAGHAALDVLHRAGPDNLRGKVLVDVSNPLDLSVMPPTLFVANDDSLAERIQRAFPEARVVKSLNTVNAALMVDPVSLADGDHDIFMSGDDPEAKRVVDELLRNRLGWRSVVDLGDLSTARGTEMLMPMWLRLMGRFGTPIFNWRVVR